MKFFGSKCWNTFVSHCTSDFICPNVFRYPLTVILVDRFRVVNETKGHETLRIKYLPKPRIFVFLPDDEKCNALKERKTGRKFEQICKSHR